MLIKVGKEDDSKTVEKILAKQEKILDKQEGNGGTARVLANNNNHLEVVKLLLTERAPVNTHHQEKITLRKTIERNNIADIPH